jgi:hypothetical protein
MSLLDTLALSLVALVAVVFAVLVFGAGFAGAV